MLTSYAHVKSLAANLLKVIPCFGDLKVKGLKGFWQTDHDLHQHIHFHTLINATAVI